MRNASVLLILLLCFFGAVQVQAQMRGMMNRMGGGMGGGMGSGRGGGGGSDSLSFEKRNFADDSVNVRFRYLDTARYQGFDSSIHDFYRRVPLKPEYIQIGHNGNAVRPILYNPLRGPGWDAGFHALDPFAFALHETRFMNTTKPFTELGYLVGSKAEQQVSILHTQNATPDWNFVMQYRLVNAPGTFNSQNTSHNNILFNSDFNSKDKRYHAFLVLLSNTLQASENGGIKDEQLLVNENPAYNDRFNIPTNLASAAFSSRNFFNVKLITGNRYTNRHLLFRQQYDFGQKDSVVTDSTVVRFFLPRLRFEHTIQSSAQNYLYQDIQAPGSPDFYANAYGLVQVPDTVAFRSQWQVLSNDFSIIQFPEAKNPLQFFKVGAALMNYSGISGFDEDRFVNLVAHGEYRNRTRNRKWDMLLHGEFYAAGRDLGNYGLQARLQRSLGEKIGQLELGFRNINRSPSYLFTRSTSFPILRPASLNNENVTALQAVLYLKRLNVRLTADYFLQSNYTYFKGYREVAQYAPLFNTLRLGVTRETMLGRHWKWYLDLAIQTIPGDVPIHLPWLYTRNRLAWEGKPFRNLLMSTGLDLRYYASYYPDGYSPVTGQFFYQAERKISTLPDIAAYMNFRIRTFTAFVRIENLNTATTEYGFGFKNNNLAAPGYPTPGMLFRLGIFWNFVN